MLGFKVVDFDRYLSVFTHKSAVKDTGCASYERYEFLGDSVITFVVTKYIYQKFPTADEGFLTKVRTKLVSGEFLSHLARCMGLDQYVLMNQKAIDQSWHRNKRICEDVFEALVGCISLDLNMEVAKNFLLDVIQRFADFKEVLRDTNYKDALMRFSQSKGASLPEYRVLNDPQLTRQPLFHVVVAIDGVAWGQGRDASKKGAEQKAAHHTLRMLGCEPTAIV